MRILTKEHYKHIFVDKVTHYARSHEKRRDKAKNRSEYRAIEFFSTAVKLVTVRSKNLQNVLYKTSSSNLRDEFFHHRDAVFNGQLHFF